MECGSLLPLFGAEAGFRASDQPAEPAIAGDANRAAKIVAKLRLSQAAVCAILRGQEPGGEIAAQDF